MANFTDKTVETEVIALYKNGWRIASIQRLTGLHPITIKRILVRNAVPIEKRLSHRFSDISGLRFGRWLVIKHAGFQFYSEKGVRAKKKKSTWLCKCDCGETAEITGNSLRSGSSLSCGCLQRDSAAKMCRLTKRLKPGESAFNALYTDYKVGARRRGLEFNLPVSTFKNITSSNCEYCGIEPSQKKGSSDTALKSWSFYLYNGIDRVNNSLGYTEENCVPCCKTCNFLKRNLAVEVFIKKCIEIAKNNRYAIPGESFPVR